MAMLPVTFILLCLGVVLAQDPPKCCSERQFEAHLAEIGGALYDEHGKEVPALIDIDNILHYDYYNKSVVYEVFDHNFQGKTIRSRIVHDFKKGFRYVILRGKCTKTATAVVLNEQCVPANAKLLGQSYLGYGLNSMKTSSWEYSSGGTTVKSTYSLDNCVPLFQSVYSIDGPNAGHNEVFTVTNFQPGIQRPNVFQLPAACTTSSDEEETYPESVKRGMHFIDAVFSR